VAEVLVVGMAMEIHSPWGEQ